MTQLSQWCLIERSQLILSESYQVLATSEFIHIISDMFSVDNEHMSILVYIVTELSPSPSRGYMFSKISFFFTIRPSNTLVKSLLHFCQQTIRLRHFLPIIVETLFFWQKRKIKENGKPDSSVTVVCFFSASIQTERRWCEWFLNHSSNQHFLPFLSPLFLIDSNTPHPLCTVSSAHPCVFCGRF